MSSLQDRRLLSTPLQGQILFLAFQAHALFATNRNGAGKLVLAAGAHKICIFSFRLSALFKGQLCAAQVAKVTHSFGRLFDGFARVVDEHVAIENALSSVEALAQVARKHFGQMLACYVIGRIVLGVEELLAKVTAEAQAVAILVGGQVVFGGVRFFADVALEGSAEEVHSDMVLEATLSADVSLAQVACERLLTVHHCVVGGGGGWFFL